MFKNNPIWALDITGNPFYLEFNTLVGNIGLVYWWPTTLIVLNTLSLINKWNINCCKHYFYIHDLLIIWNVACIAVSNFWCSQVSNVVKFFMTIDNDSCTCNE